MRRLFLTIPFLLIAIPALGQSRIESSIGIVKWNSASEACFVIQNSKLSVGQRLIIVFAEKPQTTLIAQVKKKLVSNCAENASIENASFYRLKVRKQDFFVSLGVVSAKKIQVVKGVASVDLDGDGKKEYFRECTSNEGVHYTVWTGKPLTGKRIWHSYYHLDYDTDPTCKTKDYEGTDD